VPTTDYYALAGIFRSTHVSGGEIQKYVSDWTRRDLPVPGEHRAAVDAYEKRSAQLKAQIGKLKKDIDKLKKDIGKENKPKFLGIVVDDAEATLEGKWKNSTYTPRYVGVGYIHDNKEDKGKKSVTFTPNIPDTGEYEVRISYASAQGRDDKVPVVITHAGGEKKLTINQVTTPPHQKLFDPVGRYTFKKGKSSSVKISTEGTTDYVIVDAVQFIPVDLLDGKGDADKKPKIAKAGQSAQGDMEPTDAQMKASELYKQQVMLEKALEGLETEKPGEVPVAIAARDSGEVDDCRVRVRGETHNRGDVVPRGFLRVCSPSDDAAVLGQVDTSGRAEFARWLTRDDHPLTSRVMVNRIWYHLIGEGIVRSVDNIGELGEDPTHPRLLDTLAAEFVEDGWSIKRMIRRIVTSRVYRISARHDEKSFMADPDNRLLWRAHRKRLPAEAIRDTLLMVAGRIEMTPSENPVGDFKKIAVNNSSGAWSGTIDASLATKRSVYQPVVRGALPEVMLVFDFADPDMVVGKRPVTTVPAQALLMLNNPMVTDAAATMAEQLPRNATGVDRAFLSILGRLPSGSERQRVLSYIDAESTAGLAEGAKDDKAADAAWTRFVQSLFASTEFRMLN